MSPKKNKKNTTFNKNLDSSDLIEDNCKSSSIETEDSIAVITSSRKRSTKSSSTEKKTKSKPKKASPKNKKTITPRKPNNSNSKEIKNQELSENTPPNNKTTKINKIEKNKETTKINKIENNIENNKIEKNKINNKDKEINTIELLKQCDINITQPKEALIYNFLISKGRPVPISEIILCLKDSIKKPELTKLLEKMNIEENILMKQCVKSMVIFPKYPLLNDENLNKKYKEDFEKLQKEEKILNNKLKDLQKKVTLLKKEKTETEIIQEIEKETEIIEKLKNEIESKKNVETVDFRIYSKKVKELETNKKLLKKCINGYKEFKGMLMEGFGKKWDEIKEEIGIEED